jgi:hypothetical protein
VALPPGMTSDPSVSLIRIHFRTIDFLCMQTEKRNPTTTRRQNEITRIRDHDLTQFWMNYIQICLFFTVLMSVCTAWNSRFAKKRKKKDSLLKLRKKLIFLRFAKKKFIAEKKIIVIS